MNLKVKIWMAELGYWRKSVGRSYREELFSFIYNE